MLLRAATPQVTGSCVRRILRPVLPQTGRYPCLGWLVDQPQLPGFDLVESTVDSVSDLDGAEVGRGAREQLAVLGAQAAWPEQAVASLDRGTHVMLSVCDVRPCREYGALDWN